MRSALFETGHRRTRALADGRDPRMAGGRLPTLQSGGPALDLDEELSPRMGTPVRKVKAKVYRRECAYCGEIFESHSHAARYCPRPKQCRQRAYRDRLNR